MTPLESSKYLKFKTSINYEGNLYIDDLSYTDAYYVVGIEAFVDPSGTGSWSQYDSQDVRVFHDPTAGTVYQVADSEPYYTTVDGPSSGKFSMLATSTVYAVSTAEGYEAYGDFNSQPLYDFAQISGMEVLVCDTQSECDFAT